MAGRLRARALMLMKQLDAGGSGYRELIERELQRAAGRAGAAARRRAAADTRRRRHPPTSLGSRRRGRNAVAGSCAWRCGTVNDHDAAFCKRCGTRSRR